MILKDYFPELKEVKFSDRLLNFFELLCSHDRADLASKMVIELSLHKGYDEKQSFLRQEIDSTIHHIKELTDRTLQYALMETIEKNSTPVDYYAELFKDILKKACS